MFHNFSGKRTMICGFFRSTKAWSNGRNPAPSMERKPLEGSFGKDIQVLSRLSCRPLLRGPLVRSHSIFHGSRYSSVHVFASHDEE